MDTTCIFVNLFRYDTLFIEALHLDVDCNDCFVPNLPRYCTIIHRIHYIVVFSIHCTYKFVRSKLLAAVAEAEAILLHKFRRLLLNSK